MGEISKKGTKSTKGVKRWEEMGRDVMKMKKRWGSEAIFRRWA
jgi:hypothetical protein